MKRRTESRSIIFLLSVNIRHFYEVYNKISMKRKYIEASMELVIFKLEDIVKTSDGLIEGVEGEEDLGQWPPKI